MRSFVGGAPLFVVAASLLVATGCEHKVRRYKTASAADQPTTAAEATAEPTPGASAGPAAGCQTTCGVDSSSSLPGEDTRKIANAVDPLLKESWSCLKRVGAYKIEPTLLLRLASDGRPMHVRFDVGGYEDLNCMKAIERKFPNLQVSRGANVRCDLHCAD